MGFYASVNGQLAYKLDVMVPFYGIWAADIELATTDTVTSSVTVVVGNLTLSGTVYRSSAYAGTTYLRIVGGAGGWRKQVPSQAYANPSSSGVRASTVLKDVASLVGETVNVASDSIVGNFFVRPAASAQTTLAMVGGSEWYMTPTGTTYVGNRTGVAITSDRQVMTADTGRGLYTIATEDPASWVPANTFTSPTVPVAQTISLVRIHCGNDGIMRLNVLVTP